MEERLKKKLLRAGGAGAGRVLFALALVLSCAAGPGAAFAELRHYVVAQPPAEEKKEAGEAAPPVSRNFVVTPVQDCFSRLKPGEANEIRRDFDSPWQECQRRLRAREEEASKKAAAAKDGKGGDSGAGESPAGKAPAQKP